MSLALKRKDEEMSNETGMPPILGSEYPRVETIESLRAEVERLEQETVRVAKQSAENRARAEKAERERDEARSLIALRDMAMRVAEDSLAKADAEVGRLRAAMTEALTKLERARHVQQSTVPDGSLLGAPGALGYALREYNAKHQSAVSALRAALAPAREAWVPKPGDRVEIVRNDFGTVKPGTLAKVVDYTAAEDIVLLVVEGWGEGFVTSTKNVRLAPAREGE